jgi:hypothetical protein
MRPFSSHELIRTFTSFLSHLEDRFERKRVWGPRSIFVALLWLTRPGAQSSYRKMLETIVDDTSAFLGWDEAPSAASFSKARRHLSVASCRALLASVIEKIAACSPERFRHPSGRRFIAFDGTQLLMPRVRQTMARFARPQANSWLVSHYPQAVTLIAVDLFRRMPLDWLLLKKGVGEREGIVNMLGILKRGDVAVLDRGFPSRDLLQLFVQLGVDVVMRMRAGATTMNLVTDFLKTGKKSAVVPFDFKDGSIIGVRLVRRNFRVGRPRDGQKAQPMVVLTTLPKEQFSDDEIVKIYTARWGVETVIREIKNEFDIERFHARSIEGIEQEIAAVMTWIALASGLQQLAEHGQDPLLRVHRNLCFARAARMLKQMLEGGDPWEDIETILANLRRFSSKIRPGRSFPRKRKAPTGRYKPSGPILK